MNAVKCSIMTGQHDRSFIFHTVELLSAHAHDNRREDILKIKSVMNDIFSLFVSIAAFGRIALLLLIQSKKESKKRLSD